MPSCQRMPTRWMIVAPRAAADAVKAAARLPRGSGVLLIEPLPPRDMRRLRTLARTRKLALVTEGRRGAARVHDMRELRKALLGRSPLVLLSPLFPTRSHPHWAPLPRMRAATLTRIAGRRLVALGGMDERRYAAVAPLGFSGWAGISAWESPGRRARSSRGSRE